MTIGFDELIAARNAHVQATARELRARALEALPGAVETHDGEDWGIGTDAGYKGLVFVITPLADTVRLGIAHGASLDDPAGLMQGRGKVHRHVKVADASDPALADLMRRATQRARPTSPDS